MRKETYFTEETIQEKSQELLEHVSASHRRHADMLFRPKKAALLVLDMQRYFLQEGSHAFVPSATAIIPGINKLIAAFEAERRPAVATKHINTKEDAGMMSKWWRDLIRPEIAHSQLIDTLNIKKLIKIEKTQYDAFLHTTLEERLHQGNIEQVVITGVMTHLCCESTARSAFMRGFEVFFVVDGTATYNEKLHRASLLTLSHGFVVPVLHEELLATMETDDV
jgi:isochorismate hydrolase